MNHSPVRKNILLAAVVAVAFVLALPNPVGQGKLEQIKEALEREGVAYRTAFRDEGRALIRFATTEDQFRGRDVIETGFENGFTAALTQAPRTPGWLRRIGLKPMS